MSDKNLMIVFCVCVFYTLFVYVESMAMHARRCGIMSGHVAMGYTLHNSILSLNRFIGFAIGPAIGFLVESGFEKRWLVNLALALSISGGLVTIISAKKNSFAYGHFNGIFRHISDNGYHITSFFRVHKRCSMGEHGIALKMSNISLVFSCGVTTALYYGVSLYLGIVAYSNIEYRATIFQLTGLVTGLGSLLLNFYTFPMLAVLEKSENRDVAYSDVFIGKILGLLILQPTFVALSCIIAV